MIPLLPVAAQKPIDEFVMQFHPQLPKDIQQLPRYQSLRTPLPCKPVTSTVSSPLSPPAPNYNHHVAAAIHQADSSNGLTKSTVDHHDHHHTTGSESIDNENIEKNNEPPATLNQVTATLPNTSSSFVIDEISSPASSTTPKMASVLIPLCHQHGSPSILFTVRSSLVRTHRGQVSFPGGHIEKGETAEQAALRETREELGENVGHIKILGHATPIFAITGTLVFPILGYIERDVGDYEHLQPCPMEVDQIFCLSIKHLLNNHSRTTSNEHRFGIELSMPIFNGGVAPIWGLTGIILDGVLKHVLSPLLASQECCYLKSQDKDTATGGSH